MKSIIKVLILLTLIIAMQTKSLRKTNSKKNPFASVALCLISGALQVTAQIAINAVLGDKGPPTVSYSNFGRRKLRKTGPTAADIPAELKNYNWEANKNDNSKAHNSFLYKGLENIANKDFAGFKTKLISAINRYTNFNGKAVTAEQKKATIDSIKALKDYATLENELNGNQKKDCPK